MARKQRKLAAIVTADVVGYSRLMGRDKGATLARPQMKPHSIERGLMEKGHPLQMRSSLS